MRTKTMIQCRYCKGLRRVYMSCCTGCGSHRRRAEEVLQPRKVIPCCPRCGQLNVLRIDLTI